MSIDASLVEVGCIAWITWEGVVQDQPWEWHERYNMPSAWQYEDHRITKGVTHYMPLKVPPPPTGAP